MEKQQIIKVIYNISAIMFLFLMSKKNKTGGATIFFRWVHDP